MDNMESCASEISNNEKSTTSHQPITSSKIQSSHMSDTREISHPSIREISHPSITDKTESIPENFLNVSIIFRNFNKENCYLWGSNSHGKL